jgi:hypothetical protein
MSGGYPPREVEGIPARDLDAGARAIDRRVGIRPDLQDAGTLIDVGLAVSFEDQPAV